MTVVMAARNAASTIGAQLEALAAQQFDSGWEVVVVDDASTDATAEVARKWEGELPRLRVLTRERSEGPSACRNLGVAMSGGELIAFCDADDVASPLWLSGLVSVLKDHPLVTGPVDATRLNPHVWNSLLNWYWPEGELRAPRWNGFLAPVIGCNMAIRRDVFLRSGGFDTDLWPGEDYDLAFRVQLRRGTVGFSRDALMHYRLRRGWQYLRCQYEYGLAHVELYRRFRTRGMHRRVGAGLLSLGKCFISVPLLLLPRHRYRWMAAAGNNAGHIAGSIRNRILYL